MSFFLICFLFSLFLFILGLVFSFFDSDISFQCLRFSFIIPFIVIIYYFLRGSML